VYIVDSNIYLTNTYRTHCCVSIEKKWLRERSTTWHYSYISYLVQYGVNSYAVCISTRKFNWLTAYIFCFIQKIHSWHGEMSEDTWSKISWNIKKTIWEGLLGRQDASHVTTVELMQVSWGESECRWRNLIKSGFMRFQKTEVSQSIHFPWPFILFLRDLYTQCGPKVLGLIFFKKIEDTWGRHEPFFIQNKLHWHIYRLFSRPYSLWKAAENSSFWTFFNSSVTASWISATSAKWGPFNFIFNLRNRK